MTETTEKARIGAPAIDGFSEEGEDLSPVNAAQGPLAGAST
jgi:Fe-S cluster assembly protein SufD